MLVIRLTSNAEQLSVPISPRLVLMKVVLWEATGRSNLMNVGQFPHQAIQIVGTTTDFQCKFLLATVQTLTLIVEARTQTTLLVVVAHHEWKPAILFIHHLLATLVHTMSSGDTVNTALVELEASMGLVGSILIRVLRLRDFLLRHTADTTRMQEKTHKGGVHILHRTPLIRREPNITEKGRQLIITRNIILEIVTSADLSLLPLTEASKVEKLIMSTNQSKL